MRCNIVVGLEHAGAEILARSNNVSGFFLSLNEDKVFLSKDQIAGKDILHSSENNSLVLAHIQNRLFNSGTNGLETTGMLPVRQK